MTEQSNNSQLMEQSNNSQLMELNKKKSLYQTLFINMTNLNENKSLMIKLKLNEYVTKTNDYVRKYNLPPYNLPIYLDYILSQTNKMYPITKKYADKIIQILNYVHETNLHPYIFQSLFVNIVQSIYINQIIIDKSLDYSDIVRINPDISLLFEQFNSIFDFADDKFRTLENEIGYNNITCMSYIDFDKIFANIAINSYNLTDEKTILNVFIVQIQRMTQIKMEQNIQSLNIDLETLIELKKINFNSASLTDASQTASTNASLTNASQTDAHKICFDYDLLLYISENYSDMIKQNYIQTKFWDIFEEINIYDHLHKINCFALYFWIDYVAIINNGMFEKLLKQ
jgi:hypothetical protein